MNQENKILKKLHKLLLFYDKICFENIVEDFYEVFNGYNYYGALRFVVQNELPFEMFSDMIKSSEYERMVNDIIFKAIVYNV